MSKNYTDGTLVKGEKIIVNNKNSKWQLYAMIVWIVVGLATSAMLIGIPFLIMGIYGVIAYYYTEFAVTNKTVLAKSGIISRKTDELQLKKIEGCDVKQGIFGRMLGYGDIVVSGTGSQQVVFWNIDNPLAVKKQIDSII